MPIIFASSNPHKALEAQKLLETIPVQITLCSDLAITIPDSVECYTTYQENAKAKCEAVVQQLTDRNAMVLADDSGLEVEVLGYKPGIHSARFSATGKDKDNREKLLHLLKSYPFQKRKCQFICVLCFWFHCDYIFFEGRVDGYIVDQEQGENGFGYDPIFYYPPYKNTFSAISQEEKNKVSHRGRAFDQLKRYLLNTKDGTRTHTRFNPY